MQTCVPLSTQLELNANETRPRRLKLYQASASCTMTDPVFQSFFTPNGYPSLHPRGGPFTAAAGSAASPSGQVSQAQAGVGQFEIYEWFPAYMSCQRFFIDHAQHTEHVQAVAALVNITLPFQWEKTPVTGTGAAYHQQQWSTGGPANSTCRQPNCLPGRVSGSLSSVAS